MGTADGDDSLVLSDIEAICAGEPNFHWLVLRLSHLKPGAPAVAATSDPAGEWLRFAANPSLGFPPTEIAAIEQDAGGNVRLRVNHLGLYGPSSPLPAHVTERILFADQAESGLRDFLDFFNHRLIALSFKIWRDRQHHLSFLEDGSDLASERLAALMGLPPAAASADRLPPRGRLFPFAGMFSLFSRSSATVEALVTFCFGVPTRVEEFCQREVAIPSDQQVRLGAHGRLGEDFMIGGSVLDRSGKFRLRIGPLTAEAFRSLLPGTERYQHIGDLVRLLLREPLDWDIALELAPTETMPWRLGDGPLGLASWSGPEPAERVVIYPAPPERIGAATAPV
ncbi:MAG: type VI secretion system baseplate subunit TssG [Ancalomicrobiaceae bacterium]|nr:type VI secretion system baseplate subunit TssG [Ancalomicrobiaceae bacterium]